MIGLVDCDKSSSPRRSSSRKFKVVVEGNIASGKSTLLKKLSQLSDVEVLIEPVDQWRDVGGANLIGRMYDDCERWSYLFQSYVLLTMMELHHKEVSSRFCMLERSVYSARYCFVENLHQNDLMDDGEFACYCRWFDHLMKVDPPQLDLIVYLRTSPEVCYQRLQERGRKEEKPVTLEYLKSLHHHYEKWLGNKDNHCWHGNTPVLVINGNEDCTTDKMVHKRNCSTIVNALT